MCGIIPVGGGGGRKLASWWRPPGESVGELGRGGLADKRVLKETQWGFAEGPAR